MSKRKRSSKRAATADVGSNEHVEGWERAGLAVLVGCMHDLDINQVELARHLGWTESKLSKIVKGSTRLGFGSFSVIATALIQLGSMRSKPVRITYDKLYSRVLLWHKSGVLAPIWEQSGGEEAGA